MDANQPSPLSRRQRLICIAVVTVSLAHALSGFFLPVPAWQMFKIHYRYTYTLFDRHGEPVKVRNYLKERAYVAQAPHYLAPIAEWIGRTQPERLPLQGTLTTFSQGKEKTVNIRVTHVDGAAQFQIQKQP